MAKRPRANDPDPTDAPDGQASVIFRGGPLDGAHDALPEDAVVYANELHVPVAGGVAIYVRKKAESGLPTYRLDRIEPVYRVET